MKKLLTLFLILSLSMSLLACGSNQSGSTATAEKTEESTPKVTEDDTTEVTAEQTRDLPVGEYIEMGEGSVYISTAGGTSEDGNVPVIYAEKDLILKQIGLNAYDFNGGALSFIYIDGMLADKAQLANTQMSLDLMGEHLTEGIHTVEVVQYENDDPSAAMIAYRSMQYEIKPM